VIRPQQIEAFLTPLPVGRLPGVGKVMEAKLAEMGIRSVGELRARALSELEMRFGRWGVRLHELAQGIDEHPVQTERPTVQISAEDTFEHDLLLGELEPHIRRLADKAWAGYLREHERLARTVVLKLKTSDFRTLTRSLTAPQQPRSASELGDIACALRERVERAPDERYRLVGVGLSGFIDRDSYQAQADLFETPPD
jgi:DNA polymerase-4